jgi:hypothetical protein
MSYLDEEKLQEVFSGTLWQAELVKGVLETNGVPCVIVDETIGAVTSPYAGLDGEVLVLVNEEDLLHARRILDENMASVAER